MINTRQVRSGDSDTCNRESEGKGPCILGGGNLGIGRIFYGQGEACCLYMTKRVID